MPTLTSYYGESGSALQDPGRYLVDQTLELANDASNVFKGVTSMFLFASFMLSLNACQFGLKLMAFTPFQEGVTVSPVGGEFMIEK